MNKIVIQKVENKILGKKFSAENKNIKEYILRINGFDNIKKFLDKLNISEDDRRDIQYKEERPKENDGINIPYITDFVKWGNVKDTWGIYSIYLEDNLKDEFEKLLNIKFISKSGWFPKKPEIPKNKVWRSVDKTITNKYPIYIISKGRWEKKLTYNSLKKMNVNFKIVVETDEIQKYIDHGVDENDILEFSNYDKEYYSRGGNGGSIPVRNFIREHSLDNGFKKHWCLDDNIDGFCRFYMNQRIKIESSLIFRIIEDYTDMFRNIKMSGMNYKSFCPDIARTRVICQKNTRIYSCILLSNDTYDWRGVYNEDTDLSLRILKDKYPTCLFNCFLCDKQTTMSCKGGNTDSIYQNDGLQKKLDSLLSQHPDCVKGTIKFKKVHHQVDYRPWEGNEMIYNKNHKVNTNINYELVLEDME